MASAQLQLIHTDHTWKLDQQTVKVGRAGIAAARAALAAATQSADGEGPGSEGQLFSYNVGRTEATPKNPVHNQDGPGHQVAA